MENKEDNNLEEEVKVDSSEESINDSNNNNESDDIEVKLLEQISVLKDSLLRKTAESENLRKRLEREKADAIKYANKNFAEDLLSVLDNFERINKSLDSVKDKIEEDSNLKAFFEGIAICEKDLLSIFQKYGISRIEASAGDAFNHEFHRAICAIESDQQPEGAIVEVFQTGYLYNERLLRPTMVSVSKKG